MKRRTGALRSSAFDPPVFGRRENVGVAVQFVNEDFGGRLAGVNSLSGYSRVTTESRRVDRMKIGGPD